MSISTAPFFDPQLAQQQRLSAYDTQTRTADLELQGQRLVEDQNLFRPFLERRFGRQARQRAGNVAQRGFSGPRSGIMQSSMGELGTEQAHTLGEFERGTSRGLEDVQRAIANLAGRATITGAENVRGGAGRASERAYPQYPQF